MILKSHEIQIVEDDPYRNDILGRKESGDALTELILSSTKSLVICIDAPWGQGKTTFLRMWEQDLKNNDIPTLYFNAWESDFSEDALVCLIGEIGASIKELSKAGDESKAKEYLERTKVIGVSLLKRSVPVAARIATAGALDLDSFTENALASLTESIAKEQIERYESSKKSVKSFRDSISNLAASITNPDDPKPLVFIIDELDRCRPNYAIEILEKAKHFFSVENVVFVLGADKRQLGSSIKAIYGEGLNVNGYLRRFMDLDYVLPPPDKGVFVQSLFKKYNFSEYFTRKTERYVRYEGEQSLRMFSDLFEVYGLTLREQEHCCALLGLSIRTTPENYKLFPLFLCFLIVLKVKEPDVYKKLISDDIDGVDLLESLKSNPKSGRILLGDYGEALETYIVTCKASPHDRDEVSKRYKDIVSSGSSSEEDKYRAERIQEIIKDFYWHGGIGSLPYLIKKIEIASRFKG